MMLHDMDVFPTGMSCSSEYKCPPIEFKLQSPPLQHQKSACWETLYNMASGAVQVWMRADFTHIALKE